LRKLRTNSRIKNSREFYRGISDSKKGYQPRNNIGKDEKGDLVAHPMVFWQREGTISPTYWMYVGLMMLGRWIYTQQTH
jgi:hypothetical protein